MALVYGALIDAPPLTWDDAPNIFENPHFRNGSWTALWRAPYFGMYIPVVETIWAALYKVGEGAAWPFRVFNIALHIANVVLFAVLLQRVLLRFEIAGGAAFATGVAIFALHPQQTATICWLSGSRDLVATTFAFAAVAVLFRRGRWAEFWSTLLFIAGLLSKPQIAGVPLAIALFTWLFERERFKRTALLMAGWSLLVVASAVVTWAAQAGDADSVHVPLAHRPVLALDALGFYLMKTVWPFPLAADYGRTPDVMRENPSRMIFTIGLATFCGWALWAAARRHRGYGVGFLWPLLLLPVLGFATFGYQRISTVADHYNYLPLAIAGTLAAVGIARSTWRDSGWLWAFPALIVVVGGFASWHRTKDWRDDDHFYADMLAKNPRSYSAQLNLAASACDRGDWRAGLSLVQRASGRGTDDPGVLANTAYCLFRGGQLDDVVRLQTNLRNASVRGKLARNPPAAVLFAASIAGAFDKQGFPMRAFAYFCQAHALAPEDAHIAGDIASIHQQMLQAGRDVVCPGLLGWDKLEAIVADIR